MRIAPRRISAWAAAGLLLLSAAGAFAQKPPARLLVPTYDEAIEDAVHRWWPGFPYASWWKGQLYQESRLDPLAVSPAGARGLAQFMPGTWRDVVRQTGTSEMRGPHDTIAIDLGAWYMARLTKGWRPERRGARQRHFLALASYNAGAGNIIQAQTRCAGALLWRDIAPCLPQVTGAANARETTNYTIRIPVWQGMVERAWGRP